MGIGPFLGLLKTAARNIPWARVVESTPLLVDMLGKAKAKIKVNEISQKHVDDQLKFLHEENSRLASALLQMSKKQEALASRVSVLTKVSLIALLIAISAGILWLVK